MASISIRCQVILVCLLVCYLSSVRTQTQVVDVNDIVLPEEYGTESVSTTTIKLIKPETTQKPVTVSKSRLISAREKLVCPGNDTRIPLFTLPCERDTDCGILGAGLLCCTRKEVRFKRCLKGVAAPKPEQPHTPWLRVFPRKCPEIPIAEYREIKNCTTDNDCSPRICCPEKGTSESYCRTADIKFDSFPTVQRMLQPVTNLVGYFQCTPPPPPVLDLFPKECKSALDCFPNLCCQEGSRRICRPPRQSILSLFIGVTRRIASGSTQMTNNLINTIRN